MTDYSKMFLFVVLSLLVLVLVSGPTRRPLANAPLDPDNDVGQQTEDDVSLISRGPGWANIPTNYSKATPPLSLIMPIQGVQPAC